MVDIKLDKNIFYNRSKRNVSNIARNRAQKVSRYDVNSDASVDSNSMPEGTPLYKVSGSDLYSLIRHEGNVYASKYSRLGAISTYMNFGDIEPHEEETGPFGGSNNNLFRPPINDSTFDDFLTPGGVDGLNSIVLSNNNDPLTVAPKSFKTAKDYTAFRLTATQDAGLANSNESSTFVLNELHLNQQDDSAFNDGTYYIVCHNSSLPGVDSETSKTFTLDDSGSIQSTGTIRMSSTAHFAEITSGAVVWQSFPFYCLNLTYNRYYYVDVDDGGNSMRKWDDYDTTPTTMNYRDVSGQFVVPENCTLKSMQGVMSNNSSTNNPEIGIYHGTPTEGTGNTTLALAAGAGGGTKTINISTLRVPTTFSDTFSVDLVAGDIVVPMIKHNDSSSTRTFQGSLTLKFITR